MTSTFRSLTVLLSLALAPLAAAAPATIPAWGTALNGTAVTTGNPASPLSRTEAGSSATLDYSATPESFQVDLGAAAASTLQGWTVVSNSVVLSITQTVYAYLEASAGFVGGQDAKESAASWWTALRLQRWFGAEAPATFLDRETTGTGTAPEALSWSGLFTPGYYVLSNEIGISGGARPFSQSLSLELSVNPRPTPTPPVSVPESGFTLGLAGLALAGLWAVRRR